mgnify:CR=1 FL=1
MKNQKVNQIDKAIEEAVSTAVDRACKECLWLDAEPSMSSKLKTSKARNLSRMLWDQNLAFNEAVAGHLQLDKPSDWTPDDIKTQISNYIGYLQGFLEVYDDEDAEECIIECYGL